MKKLLFFLLIFILFTSFSIDDTKPVPFGAALKSSFVVYNNSESQMIICNFGYTFARKERYRYKTYSAQFTILEEKTNSSIESKPTCFPVIDDHQIISHKIYSLISFNGKVEKAILNNNYIFFRTTYEIFVLDLNTMHFFSLIERKESIYDFDVQGDELYIVTNQGIEIIGVNKNRITSFENRIGSIEATTGKKHLIISEINDDGRIIQKRILRKKDLKEKITIANPNLLKNLIDITSDNNGLVFNNETKSLSLYNLKTESKLKDIILPVQNGEQISKVNILEFKNSEIIAEITYSRSRSNSEIILTKINLETGSIKDIVEFENNCQKHEYETTR